MAEPGAARGPAEAAGSAAGLEIRPLAPVDAAAYGALRLRALAENPTAFTSSLEEVAGKPGAFSRARLAGDPARPGAGFLGAFVSGELVGQVGLELYPRMKQRHLGVLVGLYVAPEHTGRGIARALVDALIGRARAIPDLRRIQLTVTEDNVAAIALYRRVGFELWGREEEAIRVDGCYFAKLHFSLSLRT